MNFYTIRVDYAVMLSMIPSPWSLRSELLINHVQASSYHNRNLVVFHLSTTVACRRLLRLTLSVFRCNWFVFCVLVAMAVIIQCL